MLYFERVQKEAASFLDNFAGSFGGNNDFIWSQLSRKI